jgi:hypothetical protein
MDIANFVTVKQMVWTALGTFGGSTLVSLCIQEYVKHKYQKTISRLEAELSQQNFRHSTVFVKTEQSISGIYERLLKLLDVLEDHTYLMAGDEDNEKKIARIAELNAANKEFYSFYRPRVIYLRKSTQRKTMEIMSNTKNLLSTFNRVDILRNMQPRNAEGQEQVERMDLRFEELQNKVYPLLLALEDEFRDVLGFPKEK